DFIAENHPAADALLGEWLFSSCVAEQGLPSPAEYVDRILRSECGWQIPDTTLQEILKIRDGAKQFIEDCTEKVLCQKPKIVGLTSVFQQNVASLALAKQVKKRSPDSIIMFGGSNCEGVMGWELIRQFSFVDIVVSGEAEIVFPELVSRVLNGQSTEGINGVFTRSAAATESVPRNDVAPVVRQMDALPYPAYSDFFVQWETGGPSRV